MYNNLRNLSTFRELFRMWTLREIKIRYKQSFLGGAWAILQPFSLMVMFTLVFSVLVQLPTDDVPYPIFAYTALLPWTFFATSITFASTSLINNMNLVTKIYFPRDILPLGSIGAGLFDFGIASTILVALILMYRIEINLTLLWVPILLVIQILLMVGISLGAAAVIVFYRDMRFVIPLFLQLWLYATPVIYPISLVPEKLLPFYMLNPMAALVVSYRQVILQGVPPQWAYLGPSTIMSILAMFAGYYFFKRVEAQLADII